MAQTQNLKLSKPTTADTVSAFLEAANGNMDKLEAMPLPFKRETWGSLTSLVFSDGTLFTWGNVNLGSSDYVCGSAGQYTAGFISPEFRIRYPRAFVGSLPTILSSCTTTKYADIFVMTTTSDLEYFRGRFVASFNENEDPWGLGKSEKTLHLLALGRWK